MGDRKSVYRYKGKERREEATEYGYGQSSSEGAYTRRGDYKRQAETMSLVPEITATTGAKKYPCASRTEKGHTREKKILILTICLCHTRSGQAWRRMTYKGDKDMLAVVVVVVVGVVGDGRRRQRGDQGARGYDMFE